MKIHAIVSAGCLFAAMTSVVAAAENHWGYTGHTGPQHWGSLKPEYALCGSGKNQSPVDLVSVIEADLPKIDFDYTTSAKDILNNGHTVQVNYTGGSTIEVDGTRFELKQFHFHAPSENVINGKSFPMEGHLVHADSEGHLAVVAVMFEQGPANATIAKLWKQMPKNAGDDHMLSTSVDVSGILPKDRDYYRFNGSLTTPPCTEGVRWLVMKQPVSLSSEQISAFKQVMHHDNNRPVQPMGARTVLK